MPAVPLPDRRWYLTHPRGPLTGDTRILNVTFLKQGLGLDNESKARIYDSVKQHVCDKFDAGPGAWLGGGTHENVARRRALIRDVREQFAAEFRWADVDRDAPQWVDEALDLLILRVNQMETRRRKKLAKRNQGMDVDMEEMEEAEARALAPGPKKRVVSISENTPRRVKSKTDATTTSKQRHTTPHSDEDEYEDYYEDDDFLPDESPQTKSRRQIKREVINTDSGTLYDLTAADLDAGNMSDHNDISGGTWELQDFENHLGIPPEDSADLYNLPYPVHTPAEQTSLQDIEMNDDEVRAEHEQARILLDRVLGRSKRSQSCLQDNGSAPKPSRPASSSIAQSSTVPAPETLERAHLEAAEHPIAEVGRANGLIFRRELMPISEIPAEDLKQIEEGPYIKVSLPNETGPMVWTTTTKVIFTHKTTTRYENGQATSTTESRKETVISPTVPLNE